MIRTNKSLPRTTLPVAALLLLFAASVPAVTTGSGPDAPAHRLQEKGRGDFLDAAPLQERGRGDDLGRIRQWRSFLDRAHRAFFHAHMSTAAVKAKIEEADERIEELENAPPDDPGGRTDITADVPFLERAHRAFFASHRNTAEVKRWLEEAREGTN